MPLTFLLSRFHAATLTLVLLALAGCGGVPPAPDLVPTPPKANYHVALDQGVTLDFEVEYKISGINRKSCYAFFTGTLHNGSAHVLSRKAILDFIVTSGGERLFRNITNLRRDIPPGESGVFEFFSSPLHREGCPQYERIDVSLR